MMGSSDACSSERSWRTERHRRLRSATLVPAPTSAPNEVCIATLAAGDSGAVPPERRDPLAGTWPLQESRRGKHAGKGDGEGQHGRAEPCASDPPLLST